MGTCASFLFPEQVRRKLEATSWRKRKGYLKSKIDFRYDSSDAEWLMGSADDDEEGKIGLGKIIGIPAKSGSVFQLTSDVEEEPQDEEGTEGSNRKKSSEGVVTFFSFSPPPLASGRIKIGQDNNLANRDSQEAGRSGTSVENSYEKNDASFKDDTEMLVPLDSASSSSGDWDIERAGSGEESCFNSIPNSPEKLSPENQDKRGESGRKRIQDFAKDKFGDFTQKFPPLFYQEDKVRLIATDDEEGDDSDAESEVFFDFQNSIK